MAVIVLTSADRHPQLLELWEQSVRASHHFLNDEQILKIRQQIIQHRYFDQVQLFHVEHQQQILVLWALQAANWKCCLFSLWPSGKVLAASYCNMRLLWMGLKLM